MKQSKQSLPSVVIVSNLYPNSLEKTRGLFIKQLVDSIAEKRRVTVVSPTPFNPLDVFKGKKQKLPYKESIAGVTVYHPRYIVIPKMLRSLTGYFFYLGIKSLISQLADRGDADLISAHWVYPDGFGASLVASKLNIPISIHALGCDINEYTKFKARRKHITNALNASSVNIVKSHELKKKIESLGIPEGKTKVIHNGVDQNKFIRQPMQQARTKLNLETDKKYCLFVGNFQIEKGLNYLIDAFSEIEKDNTELLVIGSGPLQQQIETQVANLNLQTRIRFIGRVDHTQIPDYLAAANLLCLPSLREGCPNVVLEALSCGTPVVASDVGAVRDIIDRPEFGIVVPAQDPKALTSGINAGLKIEKDSMPVFEWYDWDKNAELILNEFDAITSSKRPN